MARIGIGKREGITPSQQRAIAALLEARDVQAAAAAAGIPARSLYRWMGEEAFRHALLEAQGELLRGVLRRLTHASSLAIDVLERSMREGEPLPQQLRAADITLSRLLKAQEILSMESRLEALENVIQVEYVNNWRSMPEEPK